MSYHGFVSNIGAAHAEDLHPGTAHNFDHAFDPDPDPYRIDANNYNYPHNSLSSHTPWQSPDEPFPLNPADAIGNEEALQEVHSSARDNLMIESDGAYPLDEGHQHSGPHRLHCLHSSGHPDGRQREGSFGATSLAPTAYVPSSLASPDSSAAGTAGSLLSSSSPISLIPVSESRSGSSHNVLLDSNPPSSSSPASATPQELAHPPDRRHHNSRPFERTDVSHSPRRSSLTPTIHPNRRLPQPQYHVPLQNRPTHRPADFRDHDNALNHILSSSSSDNEQDLTRSGLRQAREQTSASSDSSFRHDLPDQDPNRRAAENVRASLTSGPSSDVVSFDDSEDEEDGDGDEENEDLLARQGRQLQHIATRGAARAHREVSMPHPNRDEGRDRPTAAIDWGSDSDLGLDEDGDDELIEVVLDRQVAAPPMHRQQSQQRRRHGRSGQARQSARRHNNAEQRRPSVDVIDLTEEPDSPILLHQRPMHLRRDMARDHIRNIEDQRLGVQQEPPRNPRRQTSQIARTPSLTRSDGSLLGGGQGHTPVIDLTNSPDELDDLELEEVDVPADRRLPAPRPAAQRNHRRSVEFIGLGRGFIPGFPRLGNIGTFRGLFPGFIAAHLGHNEADIQLIEAHQFAMNANPLAGNQPEFNYQANGFGGLAGRQPTPKPDFEPPPPARPGFTRHTGPDRDTNDEMVVVCASCDDELKYSAAADDDDGPRPAKRPRNKKDREEHHFWAVKGCGHVYCRACYENRKKFKSKDYDKLGFQVDTSHKTAKVFCAVDTCDSDVTSNHSWVGIFM